MEKVPQREGKSRDQAAASVGVSGKLVSAAKAIKEADPVRFTQDKQLEMDACEIRIRAERRLGEMLSEQKRTVGLATGTRGQKLTRITGGAIAEPPENDKPTLAAAGIDKKLSARSQAIAAIPEAKFEAALDAAAKTGSCAAQSTRSVCLARKRQGARDGAQKSRAKTLTDNGKRFFGKRNASR